MEKNKHQLYIAADEIPPKIKRPNEELLAETFVETRSKNQQKEYLEKLLSKSYKKEEIEEIWNRTCENADSGNNILHVIAEHYNINEEVIELSKILNIDIGARNEKGTTPLQIACTAGRIENVKKLLERGADLHIADNEKLNALHYAVQSWRDNKEIIELLLNHSVNINGCDVNGTTPLQMACKMGHVSHVKKLLENSADVNFVDNVKLNALHYAIQRECNFQVIELLVDHGVNMNTSDVNGSTPLQILCEKGEAQNVKKLLESNADVNIVDSEKANLLHHAVRPFHPDLQVIEILLTHGVNLNAGDVNGTTPLQILCEKGEIESVQKLLASNADVNAVDSNKATALHYAAQYDYYEDKSEIFELLLSYGANLNARDANGTTALQIACKIGRIENVKKLIQNGADIKMADNKQNTVLHYAAQTWNPNAGIIDLLVEKGVDVNARNVNGETPLHYACKDGYLNKIHELVENGAEINAVGVKGRNVLHYASASSDAERIDHVLSLEIDLESRDEDGATAFLLASKYGDEETVQELIDQEADVHVVDKKGRTALHYAVENRRCFRDTIKILLYYGVDIKARDSDGHVALDYGIKKRCFRGIKAFIDANAFSGSFDANSAPFLYYSVYSGSSGVQLFLSNCKDLNEIDKNNEEFPLYFAAVNGELDKDRLVKMTGFINSFNELKEYSSKAIIEYLEHLSSAQNLQIDEIFENIKYHDKIRFVKFVKGKGDVQDDEEW